MSVASSIAGGGSSGSSGGGIGGSTGGLDNALIRSDGIGGTTIQSTGITVNDSNAISGVVMNRLANFGGGTLAQSDSGSLSYIELGNGSDSITLPASPSVGTFYDFIIPGTDELTIQVQGSHVIRLGSGVSSAGGTAKSSTRGSRIQLVYGNANNWYGISSGIWLLV